MMVRKLMTMVGYAKAPKATFVLKHPVKGAAALMAYKAARKTKPRTKAVLAGAVALPLAAAYLVGKAARSGD